MSKIGTYNLELQEQANELGYSTVQEMLDALDKLNFEYGQVSHSIESLLQEQQILRQKISKIRNIMLKEGE